MAVHTSKKFKQGSQRALDKDQFHEILEFLSTFLEKRMDNLNEDRIQKILEPLSLPEGLIKVTGTLIQVQDRGNKPEEYRQLERARQVMVMAGLDAVEVDARSVLIDGMHPDPEFVKFKQASAVGTDAFEGWALHYSESKLLNED